MKKIVYAALIAILVAGSFLVGAWYAKRDPAGDITGGARGVPYSVDPVNPTHTSDKAGLPPYGMKIESGHADEKTPGKAEGLSPSFPSATVRISPEKQQLIGVKIATVEKAPSSHTLRVLGRIVLDETRIYRLNSATDGWVKKILPVTTGSLVKKEELLATFYAPEFSSALKAFIYGMRSLDRFEKSGRETKEQLEQTGSNIEGYRNSLRNLGMTEHQLNEIMHTRHSPDNIEIRAPGPGFIVARNLSLGQRFDKGTELYRIADLSHIWILELTFTKEKGATSAPE